MSSCSTLCGLVLIVCSTVLIFQVEKLVVEVFPRKMVELGQLLEVRFAHVNIVGLFVSLCTVNTMRFGGILHLGSHVHAPL